MGSGPPKEVELPDGSKVSGRRKGDKGLTVVDLLTSFVLALVVSLTVVVLFARLNEDIAQQRAILDQQTCIAESQARNQLALGRLMVALADEDPQSAQVAIDRLNDIIAEGERIEADCEFENLRPIPPTAPTDPSS